MWPRMQEVQDGVEKVVCELSRNGSICCIQLFFVVSVMQTLLSQHTRKLHDNGCTHSQESHRKIFQDRLLLRIEATTCIKELAVKSVYAITKESKE